MDEFQNRDIYLLGGHQLAADYITKLFKAREEGLLSFSRIFSVDPALQTIVDKKFKSSVTSIKLEYHEFMAQVIGGDFSLSLTHDLLIPDHTAPHVLFQVFCSLVKTDSQLKNASVEVLPFNTDLGLPFQKTFDSGISALSFAQWVCPLECTEPGICPKIEYTRTWDFNETFQFVKRTEETNPDFLLNAFSCSQLVYGIASLSFADILREWQRVITLYQKPSPNPLLFLVATFSRCHGIVGLGKIEKHG